MTTVKVTITRGQLIDWICGYVRSSGCLTPIIHDSDGPMLRYFPEEFTLEIPVDQVCGFEEKTGEVHSEGKHLIFTRDAIYRRIADSNEEKPKTKRYRIYRTVTQAVEDRMPLQSGEIIELEEVE